METCKAPHEAYWEASSSLWGGGGGEGVECTEDDRSYEVTKYQPWF